MEKLYYQTPYIKTFDAEVISCTEGKNGLFKVILNRTGFYPEGGGQPSDTGRISGIPVVSVHEKDGQIIHYTEKPVEIGLAACVIDWEERYSNMQQHSGEHLLSGLIHRRFGYDNVGFHMGKEEITIDFNGLITAKQAEELELQANRMIYDNLPVLETYPGDAELAALDYRSKKELTGQVRIIEIPGGDVCACCGTHVMRTGEIGLIKITGMMHYKNGVRLFMLCGGKALEDYEKRLKQTADISVLLSAKPELIVDTVEKLKQESNRKDGELYQLYLQLFQVRTEAYPRSDQPLILFEPRLTPIQLRQFCTLLYESGRGSTVLVCSGKANYYQYALGSGTVDMRGVSKSMNEKLHGRGGGSALMAQGTFLAPKEEILAAWAAQS